MLGYLEHEKRRQMKIIKGWVGYTPGDIGRKLLMMENLKITDRKKRNYCKPWW